MKDKYLISAKLLENILEVLEKHYFTECGNYNNYDVISAIKALELEMLNSVPTPDSKWVRCDEGLPEKSGEYLISYSGRVMSCRYFSRSESWQSGLKASHWQPLPQKPEQEK